MRGSAVSVLPQDWMDFWAIVLVAALPTAATIYAAKANRGIAAVREQVKNAHSTNLRDDLDRAINLIEALTHDVQAIRTGLADEEKRRRDHIAELRDEVQRKLGDR